MRSALAAIFLSLVTSSLAQSATLPDAPEPSSTTLVVSSELNSSEASLYSSSLPAESILNGFALAAQEPQSADPHPDHSHKFFDTQVFDAHGNPIPLERQQPARILGFIPNFRSVSIGADAPPPSWKNNLITADHQAFDYSSFFFLGLTSITAEGFNEHPLLGKGPAGFYAYTWRGFIDKTDGTFLSAFLLPSLLHEDTRYYPLGTGHSIPHRVIYVIERQAIARNYEGRPTPNIANLGGKALTQVISQYYYPYGSSTLGVLTEKFGYSVMRDVGFSAIREFYPDVAAHYIRKHREKVAREAALDAQSTQAKPTSIKPAGNTQP